MSHARKPLTLPDALRRAGFLSLLALSAPIANAQVTVVSGTWNAFRDNRSTNDIHSSQGDEVQYGADISGGSAGDFVRAFDPTTGMATGWSQCGPLAVNENFCSSSFKYSSTVINVDDPWRIQFTNNPAAGPEVSAAAPSIAAAPLIPFPTNVTISAGATPLTPVISWTDPAGYVPNGIRINIYDKGQILPNGVANNTESITLTGAAAAATSFTLPAPGVALKLGGNYAIGLQLISGRGGVVTSNNATFLSRSQSYFDFSPQASGPLDVQLPTITSDGVYSFHVGDVSSSSITFIDPAVATGYTYATATGEPNFKSVLLPDTGGGHFTLTFTVDGVTQSVSLDAGAQFFFPGAGVSTFVVSGIDPAAGIDPTNGEAFITGLTFESDGSFDGTMTPMTLTVGAVPEPGSLALMLGGLACVGFGARKRSAAARASR
ncbi:PEP-CTERM sorting domain-containing protein [Scleromatobacter humisilvae]|uniref:PEP-CTERM sorting domain-containing protein n=1 Tax=Scleromatobacter humisilvae TaxID=2897159 RepID=A0A9X1YKE6_9BURK|nr:PEP-CTERM sorting domain-containing protein [Scleromatobacter humisilvae]MCK9686002.1 PEP-CTERM sorting domain-containing protein [Scleromatobacter humisilvae]